MRLAYGVCAGPSKNFQTLAAPSIRRVDPGAPILVRRGRSSIFRAYNSILDQAIELDVDGLVLIHDDMVIRDRQVVEKLAVLFENPSIGIVGVIGGAGGIKRMGWSEGTELHGRAEQPGRTTNFGTGTFDVDVVDGIFLALSRKAMRTVRFDTQHFSGFHGYDADICMQAKTKGFRVMVSDIDTYHDKPYGVIAKVDFHPYAIRMWRAKWCPFDELTRRERLIRRAGRLGRFVNAPYIDSVAHLFHHRI